jgi:hypothetical protein
VAESGLCSRLCANGSLSMPSMLPLLYAPVTFEFSGRGFDAETTDIIRQAFDKACKALDNKVEPAPSVKAKVAERLIEIAARGARAPDEMCEAALVSLGLKPNRFTVAPRPRDPGSKLIFGSGSQRAKPAA